MGGKYKKLDFHGRDKNPKHQQDEQNP